jgi:hypothetical protein
MSDISITPASFVPSANATIIQGIAGATLTRGQPVYLDAATGTYKLYVATSITTDGLAGLMCEDVAINQPCLVLVKDPALVLGGTLVTGDTVWTSLSGLTKTIADLVSTWRIWVAGVATSSTVMNFSPVKGGVK